MLFLLNRGKDQLLAHAATKKHKENSLALSSSQSKFSFLSTADGTNQVRLVN